MLGDKKKDTLQTKVGATGAFFGTRAAVRGIARILGLPRPLALLCSSVVASVVSEAAKGIGRAKSNEEDLSCPIEEQGLKGSEITGDISKWLIYDLLEDKAKEIYPVDMYFNELILTTFAVGFVAGIGGLGVKQAIESRTSSSNTTSNELSLPKFVATGIEGGVLFASFQLVLKAVGMIVPQGRTIDYWSLDRLSEPFLLTLYIIILCYQFLSLIFFLLYLPLSNFTLVLITTTWYTMRRFQSAIHV